MRPLLIPKNKILNYFKLILMNMHPFSGTGVALVTPFHTDGKVDFNSLTKLVDHAVGGKLNYLVVMGTTGESVVLDKHERDAVINHILEINNNRLPVVLGIGGNNTRSVADQITSQDFDGISGILSVSPYYNKPTQKGIYEHYRELSLISPLPIILYNVPGRTGSCISAETTLMLAHDFDNIVATKEASGNLDAIMQIIKNKPDNFAVISGDDALSLPMIALGAEGVISVIANGLPSEMSSLINFCLSGDFRSAREIQYRLIDLIDLLFTDGNPAGIKVVLNYLGITGETVRLPLTEVSQSTREKIIEILS